MEDPGRIVGLWRSSYRDTFSCPFHISKNRRNCDRSPFRQMLSSISPLRIVHASEHAEDDEQNTTDQPVTHNPLIYVPDSEIEEYLRNETGKDRLKALFSLSGDKLHPDMVIIRELTTLAAFCSGLWMSPAGARLAVEAHRMKSQHLKFDTKFMATRARNDAAIIGGIKSAMTWGAKTFVFTGLFLVSSKSIAVYRNKSSVWEYMAGAGMTGAILRLHMGLLASVTAGAVASVLGFSMGVALHAVMVAAGHTEQRQHYSYIEQKLRTEKEMRELSTKLLKTLDADADTLTPG